MGHSVTEALFKLFTWLVEFFFFVAFMNKTADGEFMSACSVRATGSMKRFNEGRVCDVRCFFFCATVHVCRSGGGGGYVYTSVCFMRCDITFSQRYSIMYCTLEKKKQ